MLLVHGYSIITLLSIPAVVQVSALRAWWTMSTDSSEDTFSDDKDDVDV